MRKIMSLAVGVLLGGATLCCLAEAEKSLGPTMKEILGSVTALKKDLDAKNGAEAEKESKKLEGLFKDVEKFWAARKTEDAVKFSKDSQKEAAEVGKAAKAGNFEKALTAHGEIGKNCQGCHTAHREKLPDGGFKIK
ncbi:MAG: hypothetical protein U0V70_11845 [Terriglobia bacterium]